ncbi:Protein suppressor of sable, partial [Gryllus bimaculatus]
VSNEAREDLEDGELIDEDDVTEETLIPSADGDCLSNKEEKEQRVECGLKEKTNQMNECSFSHDACPPRKMEVCRYYLMDACAKKSKCLYMHQDFPCKFFHTGLKCYSGDRCKFSHGHLSETMRAILAKHLKAVPKAYAGKGAPRIGLGPALLDGPPHPAPQPPTHRIPSLLELQV